MIRKLVVVLLSIVVCFLGITPVLAQKVYPTLAEYEKLTGKILIFNEAPMLRVKVAAGELPAVEERLPEEPLVVKPVEKIGKYGGVLYQTTLVSPSSWHLNTYMFVEPPVQRSPDGNAVYPNIFKDYKVSPDYRTFTFSLRKGLKWSDGYPVTADDVMFWYEDMLLNDELTPVKSGWLKWGGELVKIEKVDDYTVRFRFFEPYPAFIETILSGSYGMAYPWGSFPPKHYLKKYHIKYNPEANELAKKEGFEYWYQLFARKSETDVVDRPTLTAWVLKKMTTNAAVFERNPYYGKIDTAGNQLPYIDRIETKLAASAEAYKMSVIGGETYLVLRRLTISDYPLLKKNQAKGNYTVYDWGEAYWSAVLYCPNQNHPDPVLKKIFQDLRFRKALSLAINREEINRLLFFGKGTPAQFSVPPIISKYHVPEYFQAYAEYDPEKASQLLDEMGLKWDKDHTYRLRADGKTLFVKIEGFEPPMETPTVETAELVRDYWEAIGIKVDFDFSSTTRFVERLLASKTSIPTHSFGSTGCNMLYNPGMPDAWFCNVWVDAFTKGGRAQAEKEGAPEEIIRYFELTEEFAGAVDEQKKIKIAKEISGLWAKNLWYIGTIGGSLARPLVVKNYLHNVPKEGIATCELGYQRTTLPSQYFISK